MKLQELSKAELCELVKLLLGAPGIDYRVNSFLLERWQRISTELLNEFEQTDMFKDFAKFDKLNKQLDKLHFNSHYYLTLDELNKDNYE